MQFERQKEPKIIFESEKVAIMLTIWRSSDDHQFTLRKQMETLL
jgi:hypothetical protein